MKGSAMLAGKALASALLLIVAACGGDTGDAGPADQADQVQTTQPDTTQPAIDDGTTVPNPKLQDHRPRP